MPETGNFKELKVYRLSYSLAMSIFQLVQKFPKWERYSLRDQLLRSSRSVSANIAEGYRKRIYPNHFRSKMTDADAEASETTVFLDFAKDCGYLNHEFHAELIRGYTELGKMLGSMIRNPHRFQPKAPQT